MRVAVVPARGGSKRLPRKNIAPFFGHPLLAFTVAAARNSGLFDHVVVTTEDAEVRRVAEDYGGDVVDRPPALAADDATMEMTALHALDALAVADDTEMCLLMPNCPLRTSGDIVDLHRRFTPDRSFQISAVPFRGVYPHWSLAVDAQGRGSWFFGEALVPSQELTPVLCPTGAAWWVRVGAFRSAGRFYGEGFHVAEMDADRGIDIDRPDELELARLIVLGLRARDGADPLEPVTRVR